MLADIWLGLGIVALGFYLVYARTVISDWRAERKAGRRAR